jgi:hypothetical protein
MKPYERAPRRSKFPAPEFQVCLYGKNLKIIGPTSQPPQLKHQH